MTEWRGDGAGHRPPWEVNLAAFDGIFSRHGNPKVLITDNGPPFNGGHEQIQQRYLRQEGIVTSALRMKQSAIHSIKPPDSYLEYI